MSTSELAALDESAFDLPELNPGDGNEEENDHFPSIQDLQSPMNGPSKAPDIAPQPLPAATESTNHDETTVQPAEGNDGMAGPQTQDHTETTAGGSQGDQSHTHGQSAATSSPTRYGGLLSSVPLASQTSAALLPSAEGSASSPLQAGSPTGEEAAGDGEDGAAVYTESLDKLHSLYSYLDHMEKKIEREYAGVPQVQTPAPATLSTQKAPASVLSSASVPLSSRSPVEADTGATSSDTLGAGAGDRSMADLVTRSLNPLSQPTTVVASAGGDEVFDGIKSRMMAIKVQLEDREETITLLREAVGEMKQKEVQLVRAHGAALRAQRQEYEAAIQRHLSFIDRLLHDKQDLNQKCEQLAHEVQNVEAKYAERLEQERKAHVDSVKAHKVQWAQAEKVRRDNWIASKTRVIKEMTIKGLEPEIQKLIEQSKGELGAAEERHRAALEQQAVRLQAEFSQQVAVEKEHALEEKERALLVERESTARRIKAQMDRYEGQLAKVQAQYDRELRGSRERLAAQKAELERGFAARVEAAVSEAQRKGEMALAHAKEKERLEREQWQHRMLSRITTELEAEKEKLKAVLVAERDRELESVIATLSAEAAEESRKNVRKYESRISDLRRQLAEATKALSRHKRDTVGMEEETLHLRATRQMHQEQLDKLRAQNQDLQTRVDALRAQNEQQAAAHSASMQTQLTEMRGQLETLIEEKTRLAAQHAEVVGRQEMELKKRVAVMERRKTDELAGLHARVEGMLRKKDAVIADLKEKLHSKDLRIKQTEMLLKRQRAELLAQLQ